MGGDVSAEIAVWRLHEEEQHPPEHFDPVWKLYGEHPLQFPLATWNAIAGWGIGGGGVDLGRTFCLALACAFAKTSAEQHGPCAAAGLRK